MPKRMLARNRRGPTRATRPSSSNVERRYTHPLFKKTVRRTKKYKAHDEANTHKVGDRVQIVESAPISKHKRWTVVEST